MWDYCDCPFIKADSDIAGKGVRHRYRLTICRYRGAYRQAGYRFISCVSCRNSGAYHRVLDIEKGATRKLVERY